MNCVAIDKFVCHLAAFSSVSFTIFYINKLRFSYAYSKTRISEY